MAHRPVSPRKTIHDEALDFVRTTRCRSKPIQIYKQRAQSPSWLPSREEAQDILRFRAHAPVRSGGGDCPKAITAPKRRGRR